VVNAPASSNVPMRFMVASYSITGSTSDDGCFALW